MIQNSDNDSNFNEKTISFSFKYYNYTFFPNDISKNFGFFYLCKYNYVKIMRTFLKIIRKKKNSKKHVLTISNNSSSENKIEMATKTLYDAYFLLEKHDVITENLLNSFNTIEKVSIPSIITSIEKCAFMNHLSLVQVSIPFSVTSIGKNAFRDCVNLIEIVIPPKVTKIGGYAFDRCMSLTKINT